MKLFPTGHATHPQWIMAAGLVLAQVRAQMALADYASAPTLGLLYITDHYADDAQEILDHLSAELPEVTDWSGTVAVGVAANNAEYFDEPGMSLMLCALPSDQYRVFSGVAPLGNSEMTGFEAYTALVHADPRTHELAELVGEMQGVPTPATSSAAFRPGATSRCSSRSAATATSAATAQRAASSRAA